MLQTLSSATEGTVSAYIVTPQPPAGGQQETPRSPRMCVAERQVKSLFAVDRNVTALVLWIPTAAKYFAFYK